MSKSRIWYTIRVLTKDGQIIDVAKVRSKGLAEIVALDLSKREMYKEVAII